MKKRFYLFTACVLFGITVWPQNIIVKGRITDVDTVMILFRSMDRCDTVFTTNGQFKFSRTLLQPELFTIVCIKNKQSIEAIKEGNERKMRSLEDGVSREFFFESGEVTITTGFANFGNIHVLLTQHKAQDKYDEFRKRFNPLVKIARAIIDSSYSPKRTEQEKQFCRNLSERMNQIENEVAERFITENADNAAGAYVLYRYYRVDSYHKLDSVYKLFRPGLQATGYLKNIKAKITALSGLTIGAPVPSFTAKMSDGAILNLSDFKGKYVVLDFWGSWCLPCINGFPKMKEYYSKYGDKIAFVGIACNDNETDWKSLIKKHNVNWIHVFNNKGANDLSIKYNVESYPTKIVIDDKGNLVQVFTGESANFYQKLDYLFKTQSSK